jgi:hypothetical protein
MVAGTTSQGGRRLSEQKSSTRAAFWVTTRVDWGAGIYVGTRRRATSNKSWQCKGSCPGAHVGIRPARPASTAHRNGGRWAEAIRCGPGFTARRPPVKLENRKWGDRRADVRCGPGLARKRPPRSGGGREVATRCGPGSTERPPHVCGGNRAECSPVRPRTPG